MRKATLVGVTLLAVGASAWASPATAASPGGWHAAPIPVPRLVAVQAGWAADQWSSPAPAAAPRLTLNPTQAPTGKVITVTLTNFTASAAYSVTDQATGQELGGLLIRSKCHGTLDATGSATRKCRIPLSFSAGAHTLLARDAAGRQATASFTVTGSGAAHALRARAAERVRHARHRRHGRR